MHELGLQFSELKPQHSVSLTGHVINCPLFAGHRTGHVYVILNGWLSISETVNVLHGQIDWC